MITLTRLDQRVMVINAELIKMIESTPDTIVTLVNGDTVIVRESMEEAGTSRDRLCPADSRVQRGVAGIPKPVYPVGVWVGSGDFLDVRSARRSGGKSCARAAHGRGVRRETEGQAAVDGRRFEP